MSLNNKYYLTKCDSKIQIKFKSSQDFRYECEVKTDFVTYLSDMGGLIALWFGLSFIDMSSLINLGVVFLKDRLSRLNMQKLFEIFGKCYFKNIFIFLFKALKKILVFIEKHDLKTFFTLLSVPIFLYQIYELVDSYLQFSTEVSVEIISYRDSDNNIRYNVLPAITVCNDHMFEELLFNKKIRSDLWDAINNPVSRYSNRYTSHPQLDKDVFKSNNPFFRNLSQYYKYYSKNFFYFSKKFDYFHHLIDVDNQEQFKQNSMFLNNKQLAGFNLTMVELDIYSEFACIFNSDLIIFNGKIIHHSTSGERQCSIFKYPLKILSPFGKCLTYLYGMNEIKLFLKLNQYFLFFNDDTFEYFLQNKFQSIINRRFIIHSQDMLPIMTDSDLYFTETTVNLNKCFSIKLTKYEFERLPKPYDTNCQMYGNRTRFQCLNECYFDGYMNSDIKCIPNSESLYTFVIEGDIESQRKIFCESDDENSIKSLNRILIKECGEKCLVSCDDTYLITDYDEIKFKYLYGRIFKFILKDIYYKRIKYSAKMTFFILMISIANIWSLWHGITFIKIFEFVIRISKFKKFIDFLLIIGKNVIICFKLEKIIFYFIEFEVINRINIQVFDN